MDESYKMHNFVVHEQKKYMYMDYKCSRHGHNFLPNSIYHMTRSFGKHLDQCQLRTVSPNLMLTKITCYTVFIMLTSHPGA